MVGIGLEALGVVRSHLATAFELWCVKGGGRVREKAEIGREWSADPSGGRAVRRNILGGAHGRQETCCEDGAWRAGAAR